MQVCFNTTQEVADALQALADAEGKSRSEVIVGIVGEHLTKLGKELEKPAVVKRGGDYTKECGE